MKNLGHAYKILGMNISRNKKLKLHSIDQQNYFNKILKTFDIFDCKPNSLPSIVGHNLDVKCNECSDILRNIPKMIHRVIPWGGHALSCQKLLFHGVAIDHLERKDK